MRKALPILLALAVIGCSSEPVQDDSKPAPAVSYKMVPATTGGGNIAPTAPTTAPAPTNSGNPASPGSD
ncbi:hypothetical protein EON82_16895 [bacterium]|nr:MAG: hypothetical protein EON82_16895 [bacterium]